MAIVAPIVPSLVGICEGYLVTWTPLTSANPDGSAATTGGAKLTNTYQIDGVPGLSTVVLKGSLDGVTWFTLKDAAGVDISVTAAAFGSIRDLPIYVKPTSTGGDGTQAVSVRIFSK